ncbi:thylakoid membrane photosystem I accumulation factor [Merismopedia glauca]|nr:thylakoid membrane photosystem I accumulation factor [Merismopedia glauca]
MSNLFVDVSQRFINRALVALLTICTCIFLLGIPPAYASLTDDRFDGNVFALYGGNSSLVNPKFNITQSLERHKPVIIVLYVEDSRDSKAFASTISQIQSFYANELTFITYNVDAIIPGVKVTPENPGYYYQGVVPQTIILDGDGKVTLNAKGVIPFEKIDDNLREVFNLLPRAESVKLKRRQLNEVNTELIPVKTK